MTTTLPPPATLVLSDEVGTVPWTELQAAHYDGSFGYLSHHTAKCPDKGYPAQLVQQGGIFVFVFEDAATRALDGYEAGKADALFANAMADGYGYPAWCAIYWTADFPGLWGAVAEYARGWHEHSARPVGCYGDGQIIRGAKAAGYVRFGWRTCSAGFPGSHDLTLTDLVQMCAGTEATVGGVTYRVIPVPGHDVDTNLSLPGVTTPAQIGAWSATTPPPTPELTMTDVQNILAKLDEVERKVDALHAAQKAVVLRDPRDGKAYVITPTGKWWVEDRGTLNLLIWIGQVAPLANGDIPVATAPQLDAIPTIASPPAPGAPAAP